MRWCYAPQAILALSLPELRPRGWALCEAIATPETKKWGSLVPSVVFRTRVLVADLHVGGYR